MSSNVASLVQYPLPCSECKNYTSLPAETLIKERKVTCRICSTVTRLSDQQLESLERTLQHMSVCSGKRQVNEAEETFEAEEELTD